MIGIALALATAAMGCQEPFIQVDPLGTIERLSVSPRQGPSGTAATVTWTAGQFTYSVRLKQGECAAASDGTAGESRCPGMVVLGDDLPASGSTSVILGTSGYYCAFPVRHGGIAAIGRCVRVTVVS